MSARVEKPGPIDVLYTLNSDIHVPTTSHGNSRSRLDFSRDEGDSSVSKIAIRVASLAHVEFNLGLVLS